MTIGRPHFALPALALAAAGLAACAEEARTPDYEDGMLTTPDGDMTTQQPDALGYEGDPDATMTPNAEGNLVPMEPENRATDMDAMGETPADGVTPTPQQ